jgi:hypothetical protein
MKRFIKFLNHEDVNYLWIIPIALITLPLWGPLLFIAWIISSIIIDLIEAWKDSDYDKNIK